MQEIPSCYENFIEFPRTEILPGSSERLSRNERRFGGDKKGLVNIRNQRVEPHRLITTASELGKSNRSRCQFVDPRLETMSGLSG
ncbi:hypothetical protein DY000_02021936 [Brassica cretica]|uniref:Uncharacterized protein n=1 Tax=Brassica cretica TaxID=69181 RepID=A0ABQ7E9V1_BRACR|nr:hypothetical protein DY000_02021936 [Brassica cretica]